tara:strand:+ start:483 stop:983 length:501 start_codon:yes stop_codon:yes gene_type:complete
MKLELKAIKHTAWASEETHCYQASLYVDGKPLAIVSNDGHGGPDRDYAHPKLKGDYRAQVNMVHDYFKSLPNLPSEWNKDGMEQCLEFWCSDQVNDWLASRELKKKLKTHVLVQLKGKDGIYQTKFHPTVTKGEWVINKQAGETKRILNDMPFDEALAIWKETSNA